MPTPVFVPGTISKFLSGTTELFVESVEYDETSDVDDVTHTGAGGNQVLLGTIRRATFRASGGYDTAANYGTAPPNIISNQTITSIHAKPDGTIDYNAACVVTKFHWIGGPKNGAVRWDGEFRSTGTISRPLT
jgi:hypothetical protein